MKKTFMIVTTVTALLIGAVSAFAIDTAINMTYRSELAVSGSTMVLKLTRDPAKNGIYNSTDLGTSTGVSRSVLVLVSVVPMCRRACQPSDQGPSSQYHGGVGQS